VNNSSAPSISITSPASGATVSGTVAVSTSVSSNTTSVQFKVDGTNTGAAVTSAPFSLSLNTKTLSNGSHVLTATARNSAAQTATSPAIAIIVNNPLLSIVTTSFPNGPVQVSYTASLQASGGTAPYSWSVLSGQLPTGLSLSPSTGTISGMPTVAGSFSFTIQVKDSAAATTSAAFSINITTPQPPPTSTAPFGHVLLVALENANYTDVIGSSSMPYLNGLANQYGLATQYYADTHPSIGNYLMWTTGQILTNDDSQTPTSFPVSVDNAVRELIASGNSWKQYAESIPSVGYIGGDSTCCGGTFITRHAPLPYMTDAQSSSQANNIVPFTQFATDLANNTLPKYSFITPNGCDDAHDCGLDVADSWLQTNIDPLIKSAEFQKDGLLIIAVDESGSDNTNGGGRVAAIIISPFAKLGFKSTTLYQHESVLRLMLEGLGIKVLPGAAATAPKMWEFFTFTPPT
jgi:acid phosphatase